MGAKKKEINPRFGHCYIAEIRLRENGSPYKFIVEYHGKTLEGEPLFKIGFQENQDVVAANEFYSFKLLRPITGITVGVGIDW